MEGHTPRSCQAQTCLEASEAGPCRRHWVPGIHSEPSQDLENKLNPDLEVRGDQLSFQLHFPWVICRLRDLPAHLTASTSLQPSAHSSQEQGIQEAMQTWRSPQGETPHGYVLQPARRGTGAGSGEQQGIWGGLSSARSQTCGAYSSGSKVSGEHLPQVCSCEPARARPAVGIVQRLGLEIWEFLIKLTQAL